jgi:hypothetical protein
MSDRLSASPHPDAAARRSPDAALAELLTDYESADAVVTEAGPGTVWFSAAMAAFLRLASAAGRRPIIASGEFTELSEPLRQALRFHRGGWAVRDRAGGLRNGLTGRRLNKVEDAADPIRASDWDELATAHLRPERADYAQLMVCATAQHPAASTPLPGEAIELLMAALGAIGGGPDPAAWAFGQTEPARRPWDAAELGWRRRRDQEAGIDHSAFMIAGSAPVPASMTLVLERRADVLAEHVTGLIGLGRLGDRALARKLAAADQIMTALSSAAGITFALLMARAGNQALTQPPVMSSAPIPLSILLGDGLIKGLAIDPGQALAQFQASPTLGGRGLMVPLDAASSGRPHLAELFRAVDLGRARPQMGISPLQLQTLHYASRY